MVKKLYKIFFLVWAREPLVFERPPQVMHPSIFRFTIPPGNPRAFTVKCVPTLGLSRPPSPTPRDFISWPCLNPGTFTFASKIISDAVSKIPDDAELGDKLIDICLVVLGKAVKMTKTTADDKLLETVKEALKSR